jgi:hypothetical protein
VWDPGYSDTADIDNPAVGKAVAADMVVVDTVVVDIVVADTAAVDIAAVDSAVADFAADSYSAETDYCLDCYNLPYGTPYYLIVKCLFKLILP